ncbi:MAG: hypothetical protein Q7S22_01095 [Candidatus Micrarchaeota archaeon]|nr:hypothetical protein [Candidatus Micrarchaeota archaeon]
MTKDRFSDYIYARREILMTLGHGDLACAKMIYTELLGKEGCRRQNTDNVPSADKIYGRITRRAETEHITPNPNNRKSTKRTREDLIAIRKKMRAQLMKEGYCDGEITDSIVAYEKKHGNLNSSRNMVATWMNKCVAQERLQPNPNRAYACYDHEFICAERERLMEERLSDRAIAEIIVESRVTTGWTVDGILAIRDKKLMKKDPRWTTNPHNPKFRDRTAIAEMDWKAADFIARHPHRVQGPNGGTILKKPNGTKPLTSA